jgi:hypothetical protein
MHMGNREDVIATATILGRDRGPIYMMNLVSGLDLLLRVVASILGIPCSWQEVPELCLHIGPYRPSHLYFSYRIIGYFDVIARRQRIHHPVEFRCMPLDNHHCLKRDRDVENIFVENRSLDASAPYFPKFQPLQN